MKIWGDDIRPAPDETWDYSATVNGTIDLIKWYEKQGIEIEVIDLDHDAGDYSTSGGDYINILNWLEETGRNYPIRIHSMNPVGVENMRRIIRKNRWREVR